MAEYYLKFILEGVITNDSREREGNRSPSGKISYFFFSLGNFLFFLFNRYAETTCDVIIGRR